MIYYGLQSKIQQSSTPQEHIEFQQIDQRIVTQTDLSPTFVNIEPKTDLSKDLLRLKDLLGL